LNTTSNILVGIDGTGSRLYFQQSNKKSPNKYKSAIGINNNKQFIWESHVANFWEDYQGESHYFYGPDANEMVIAGEEINEIVAKSLPKICNFINHYFDNNINEYSNNDISSDLIQNITLNGDFGIDIIGFSRGGYAAMELARELQYNGCHINKINEYISPIYVRWMGLYDPVQREIDFDEYVNGYNNNEIAENVLNVAIAERDPSIGSRKYFGNAVLNHQDNQNNQASYVVKRFKASHSGVGGAPGKGDCEEHKYTKDLPVINWLKNTYSCSDKYTIQGDKTASINAEIWMRDNAINSNVPIIKISNPDQYYQNFIDMV
jgi:hypothetical protein